VVAILRDPSKPDESPRIVLQKQWRPPVNTTVIEIPAGLIDPKESPETCAIRELKEECGYVGEVMDGDFTVSPIMFNGKLEIFHMSILKYRQLWDSRFLARLVCPIMNLDKRKEYQRGAGTPIASQEEVLRQPPEEPTQ
jgi:8-oxo-dGTP pyrophosphatase MutT (NUDIX family)